MVSDYMARIAKQKREEEMIACLSTPTPAFVSPTRASRLAVISWEVCALNTIAWVIGGFIGVEQWFLPMLVGYILAVALDRITS